MEAETLDWFRINCMNSNDDKLIVANTRIVSINMGNTTIEASESVKHF